MKAGGRPRGTAILDTVAAVLLVAGGAYLVRGSAARQSDFMPGFEVRRDADGRAFSVIDQAALRSAFERAGLPDPPDLQGADPVPVGIVLELAGAWAHRRDVGALGRLGRVYQALEEHGAALSCFAAATGLDPGEVLWWYGLGAECQATGLDDQAIEALRRARELDAGYPTTYARLGELHLERGELDLAQASFEEYCALRPVESLGYTGLGRVALARGKPAEAEELLRQAVRMTPNDYLAHRFLAAALSANGRHEEARHVQAAAERLPQYTGWLSFDPRLQESHALADTQRYLTNELRLAAGAGDYRRFAVIAERLLERRPSDYTMLGNLASVYRQLGELDKASAAIDRAIAVNPESSVLHCARAEIAFTLDDYAAAHAALDVAEALDPASPRVHEIRGRTLFLEGRRAEAIEAVARAVELDQESMEIRLLLAGMQQMAGRAPEAIRTLQSVLERDPGNLAAQRMLADLRSP